MSKPFVFLTLAFAISGATAFVASTSSKLVPYSIGGARVTFTDIPLGNETLNEDIKCIVHMPDGSRSELLATVPRTRDSATCRLPPEISSGQISVDLDVNVPGHLQETYQGSYILLPSGSGELLAEEDWVNEFVELTWDPAYFEQYYESGSRITLQASVFVSVNGRNEFNSTGITMNVGDNNLGTKRVTVSSRNQDLLKDLYYPYFYVLRPFATDSEVFLSSSLFTRTLGMTSGQAREACATFLEGSRGPPEVMDPCPNCYCKAKLDPNFVEVDYVPQIRKMAGSRLDNHQLFYQLVPSPDGSAQTCSYNIETDALATNSPAAAGWIHTVSKDRSYVDNYLNDIWPYITCCLQSESDEFCEKFHERRPIDTGHTYPGPDDPCYGTGDPHMNTFDGIKYDFMGFGEFWLIRGPEGTWDSFGVQGRMAPQTEAQLVSYYRALAIRDGNTTVQIQHNGPAIQILVNGVTLEVGTGPLRVPLDTVSISVTEKQVQVRLQTGFTIRADDVNGVYFNVYGHGAHINKGKGFMGIFGNFDGDSENDFTSRDGFVLPTTEENLKNLSLIHNMFGLTWMATPEESFFTYEDGTSWETHANASFGPIFDYPDPSTMPDEVKAICKESLACYYEYVGTGELGDAQETVDAEEAMEELKEEINEKILTCDPIKNIANGRVTVEGYLTGSMATYSCGEEFDIEGNANRMCLQSEEGKADWSGAEPTCLWTCTKCLEDDDNVITHDPKDCTKFYLCAFGERLSLDCPVGQMFNRETLLCDENYECSGEPGCLPGRK